MALEEAEDRVCKLEDENASLRELIEDMRAALQSSDARCLALQVRLATGERVTLGPQVTLDCIERAFEGFSQHIRSLWICVQLGLFHVSVASWLPFI